jgi:DNA polymerase-3 subunit epsilon
VTPEARCLRALAAAIALVACGLLVWLAAAAGLMAATLDSGERQMLAALLGPRVALLVMMGVLGLAALAVVLHWAQARWVAAPALLQEQAEVLLNSDALVVLKGQGSATTQALATTINGLVAQRERLKHQMSARVAEASHQVEQERSRLAALMAELTQSVVVCNLDGRVLLYNQQARQQFQALAPEPALAGGGAMIGLGRSIYGVLDRALVAHALDTIRQRLARGAAHPSAQFVTVTRGGQLLRAQMAAVRDPDAAQQPSGFVLMLDNITRDMERDTAQDQVLQSLTEGTRASLGNLQAAVELLDAPDLDAATRERFLGVVRDESRAMGRRLQDLAVRKLQDMKTRWPLDDMLGSDLVAAAQRRIEAAGMRAGMLDVDETLWMKLDSYALLQALGHLAQRLGEEFAVRAVQLRLQPSGQRAQLDLVWPALPMSTETVMAWETEPMRSGADSTALSVRDVVERHAGAFWFERDRARQQLFFRFLLPLATGMAAGTATGQGAPESGTSERPEYYDFDLFRQTESSHALDDQPLPSLRYTVFDTETTGLQPAAGDEIIQLGAVRVVNARLLRNECFDQLVDPRRGIPEAGIPIHGITQAMVRGQPSIDRVLPVFHAFATDTVLVAHNAAFDMRFLHLKEASTGLCFDQPVLDTLLLSAVVHPQQASHRLEAIAERFGLAVVGRHTALGDALLTAEIFLKLLPLLAAMGIHTLGQAREAAQKTYQARISY